MGTNYYIHKKDRLPNEDLIHIGQSVYKKPKGLFIWAISPEEFVRPQSKDVMIIGEYGEKRSYHSFLEMVKSREWDFSCVGTHFI